MKPYLIQLFQHIKCIPECVLYPLICRKTKLFSLCTLCRGYRNGIPTAVQAWQPCPLWEPSASHPIFIVDWGFAVFCVYCMLLVFFLLTVYSVCSFSTLILLVWSSDL